MSIRLKDTIEDSVDKLDGYHRSNLFESIPAWISASGLSKTFTVGGDSNNFYPVVISLSGSKDFPMEISIYKNLGSVTPSISGNHSNGTSSLWLRYEARYTGWDGNGGYVKTLYKSQPYAALVAHATANYQNNGGLVVWLRGGTCEYKIACTNTFTTTIYYETVNIGTSSSVQNIGPLTAVDNGGIYTSTTFGYGNISGNASTATKLATARTISLTGSVTGSGTFDGSGNLSIATTTNHTHNYAGSSSAGGAATSANKLNTDKGSATNPVYFSGGVPVACTYSLNATVPSNAKFTDTNTWRGITDSYSGTDSTISLSQKGGKALYDALVNGYASSAGNADTLDNYHASSFGIWRGNIQTDPEADDTTYTTTADFLKQIHNRSSIFNSNFSAFRGSWYYVGNVNYATGVGTLEMAGTAVLNISGNCTNDVNYKSLIFLDRTGEMFSYVSQEAGVATWSKYAKSSEIKNATVTIKQAGTSKGSFTLNQSSNVTIELTDSNTNTTYSAGSGLSLSGTTFNHASSVTAGTAGTSSATSGSTLAVPYVTINATGHVTGYGTHTHTVSGFAASSHTHTKSQITDFSHTHDYAASSHSHAALAGGWYKSFTVDGDANTYYPVVISNVTSQYPMQLVSISRHYSATAPNSWYSSTHKGGLTLTLLWNGSRYWDGNSSGAACHCVYKNETYCTMVGGLGNSTHGIVVWLRGGGAIYYLHSMNGASATADVKLSSWTDSASRTFAPTTTVSSISVGWPYAVSASNADTVDNKHASDFALVGHTHSYAASSHTHNYAGSSSAGGDANNSVKWGGYKIVVGSTGSATDTIYFIT